SRCLCEIEVPRERNVLNPCPGHRRHDAGHSLINWWRNDMKGGFYISTDMVENSIRDDFWRETSSLLYEVAPIREEGAAGISGSVRSRLFGSMVLGNTTFNRQYCTRTPSLIARTDLDFYLLQLIIAGEYRGNFAGRDLHARPGDMFILDLTRPLHSLKEAGARITLVIPRREIGKNWAMRN